MAVLPVASSATVAQSVALDASSIPAGSVQKETFTVQGIRLNRPVFVNMPTDVTGVAAIASRVTAADTIEITFWNYTGSAVNPASANYFVYQP